MIDKSQIEHLAKLAKLDLTEEEKAKYSGQLDELLVYFNELSELDTATTHPMDHITGSTNVTRLDEAKISADGEAVFTASPEVEGRLVKVRSVFSER